MKKLLSLITLIIAYVLIFNSCKNNSDECVQTNMGKVKIHPSSDTLIIPYKGNERLTFKDSLGDTLTYTCKGKLIGWVENTDGVIQTAGQDCYSKIYYGEEYDVKFYEYKQNSEIEIRIGIADPFTSYSEFIAISVYLQNWCFDEGFKYSNLKLLSPAPADLDTLCFKDSLMLGNKFFKSVYILKQLTQSTNCYNSENLQYVFYTVSQGIVGFRTKPRGTTWYLSSGI